MTTTTVPRRQLLRAGSFSRARTAALYAVPLLFGFAIRYWLWLDQGQTGMVFFGDADEYYLGAIHLWLDGSYYDEGQWLRPPLTSLFFALTFMLFGLDLSLALLAQCALSALTALLVGATARSVWQSARAGLAAAWATALYLPFAVHASLLLSETVFIFTVALAFWLFERARRGGMRGAAILFLGGMAFGAAALARPVGVYGTPLLGIWAYLELRALRPAIRATLLLAAGCALVVLPWTIRNYLVYHELVLVDTNGGVSFFLGTIDDPNEQKMQDVWKATLPNSALRQQAALDLAMENIREDPWRYISRMRNKTVALWQLDTRLFAGNAVPGIRLAQRSLGFNLLADAQYLTLMFAALLGVVLTRRRERNWALLLWPLYGTLLSAVSLGHPRLRLPLLVVPLIYAAGPFAHPRAMWRRLRQTSWRARAALAGGLLLFTYLIFSTAYIPFFRGQLRGLDGDVDALRAAQQTDPNGFLSALRLGALLRAEGDVSAARAAYQQAVALNPRSVEAHLALLRLAQARGDLAAMESARAAIDALGWDSNLAYRWAWEHEAHAPSHKLDLGSALDIGAMHGFSRIYGVPGETFRYTVTPRAQLRLQAADATTLALRLRAANQPTSFRILVDGVEILNATATRGWQLWEAPLLPGRQGEIVVEFQAPLTVETIAAPYPYGIALDWVALR